MSSLYRSDGDIPNIVLIGLPNKQSLERTLKKLKDNQIPHYAWSEPDYEFGFTSICTAPISGETRDCLRKYQVYSPGTEQSASLLTGDRTTSAPVAPTDRAAVSITAGCG